jgi:hypothetical protein
MKTTRRTILLGSAAAGATVAMPWVSRAQQLKPEYKLSVVGNRPIRSPKARSSGPSW